MKMPKGFSKISAEAAAFFNLIRKTKSKQKTREDELSAHKGEILIWRASLMHNHFFLPNYGKESVYYYLCIKECISNVCTTYDILAA